jgi:hypothetical protein
MKVLHLFQTAYDPYGLPTTSIDPLGFERVDLFRGLRCRFLVTLGVGQFIVGSQRP